MEPDLRPAPMSTLVPRLRLLRLALVTGLVIAALKVLLHWRGWEPLQSNQLVTALVAASVFLLGFLLSGVLADYKESERLPGEIAAALESLAQEVRCVAITFPDCPVANGLTAISDLGEAVLAWLRSTAPRTPLEQPFARVYEELALVSRWNPPPLQAKLLVEVANLKRSVVRIATIRETDFVPTVYLLASLSSGLLLIGLLLSHSGALHEKLFFLVILAIQLLLLLRLIADLDNPFNYTSRKAFENVSLEPLNVALPHLNRLAATARDSSREVDSEASHQ